MSFNLPSNRILKVTAGAWENVTYPTRITVKALLTPRDYFESVDSEDMRSCVPAGGKGFSFLFDSNSGKMTIRGPDMLEPVSVMYKVDETWDATFQGRCMQVSQVIEDDSSIDALLTHIEYTLPALFSVTTGLAVFCESIEIGLGDERELLQARAETTIPPIHVRIVEGNARLVELQQGIELFGLARRSARFTLAASYLREAMLCVASYHASNPYTQALIAILKCSQAIEVLFGSSRNEMRKRCRLLDIDDNVIESQILTIVIARNTLGSAHASFFIPNNDEVEIIRRFAQRSVHTVRELLLQVDASNDNERNRVSEKINSDREKPKLIERLKASLAEEQWTIDGPAPRQVDIKNDPRMYPEEHTLSATVLYNIRTGD